MLACSHYWNVSKQTTRSRLCTLLPHLEIVSVTLIFGFDQAFKPRVNSNWCGISTSIRRSRSSTELFADLLANLGKHSLQGVLNSRSKVGIDKYFAEYTEIKVKQLRETLLQHMSNVKKSVAERTHHQRQYDRRVNKKQMLKPESKVDSGKALDAGLVVTGSNGTKSEVQDESNRSGNDTDATDADIRPIYDDEPMAEEKDFAIAALKNDLRKLKGNSVDTKFAKTLVLGKPVLQSLRNQSVVRQPNAFKSKRPPMSKPRLASQVNVNNNLSKPVTQHYLPKRRASAFAKPDPMIVSSSSRNSSKNMPRFSSNDMVHNYYLEEARKKIQERKRNSKSNVMHPASPQKLLTVTNQNLEAIIKHLGVCLKCIHVLRLNPIRPENNKPIDQKSHTQEPDRQIVTGHRFSPNRSSIVYEKTSPRSDLRWKPTGRIFKTVGLRWVPTGKILASYTSKVDSEPPYGSNVDITKIYECKQTLNLSAGTSINVQKKQSIDLRSGTSYNVKKENLRVWLRKRMIS
nr:hypothetical protein [Tanacetum cinerariifolium]